MASGSFPPGGVRQSWGGCFFRGMAALDFSPWFAGRLFFRQVHAAEDEGDDDQRPQDVRIPHHARVHGGHAKQEPPGQGQQAKQGRGSAAGEEDIDDESPELGKTGQRDQPFPVVLSGPDKRTVGAGCGKVSPYGA